MYLFFKKDKEKFPTRNTKLVLVDPEHGCEVPKNAKQIRGNIAFVKRGLVFYTIKQMLLDKCNLF